MGDPASTLTLIRKGGTLTLQSRKIGVEVIAGPQEGLREELDGPEVRVGSGKGCDFVVKDPTVSRHHLTLMLDEIGLRVIDSGSRNATFLDGIRVRDAYARPGAVLDLGATQIRIKLMTGTAEVPISARTQFGALLGGSIAMRRMFGLLERVAPSDTTVLIEGETGSGKELVAEALHEESKRVEGPFIVFDCSAVPPNLIESELFGHVKGAFTGAVSDRLGAFERADHGTLFIDEIGELPLELQPKLLRVLESREVRRIGDDKVRAVDVRIVAATNRSLSAEMDAGRFREDLYYRLAVVLVQVPPLRYRIEDVPMLVAHFHQQLVDRGQTTRTVSQNLMNALQSQSWPGNVRELRNAVEMAMALGPEGEPTHPPGPKLPIGIFDFSVPLSDAVEQFERAYVSQALKKTNGNVSRAAELAGTNRKFIQRAIKRYGLR